MKEFIPTQFGSKRCQRPPVVSRPLGSARGFTLTEVLVVLGIMVILFAMLFVPITSSIEMTRTAHNRSQMNQTLRLAMEQFRRELSDAADIYLPEYIDMGDGTYLINYCNITFIPSNQAGLTSPRVVRYTVHTPETTRNPNIITRSGINYLVEQETTVDNPFVLYRQEGYMRQFVAGGPNYFGSDYDEDGDGTDDYFLVGMPLSENALTPVREADIPVTQTVCLDASGYYVAAADGYVRPADISAVFTGGAQLVYIHGGIQFTPLRVEGERIEPGANQTIYPAQHGHWLGLHNPTTGGVTYSIAEALWWSPPGAPPFPSFPALIYSSELRPRIVVRRNNSLLLDTDAMSPSDPVPPVTSLTYDLRWNSVAGTVSVWLPLSGPARAYATFSLAPADIPNPGEQWQVTTTGDMSASDMQYTRPGGRREQIDLPGAFFGTDWVPMSEADTFVAGEDITIDPGGIAESATIGTVVSGSGLQLTANLLNNHAADTWVQANEESAKAPSIYTINPGGGDKMIVPDSVRVWAVGENDKSDGSTQQASLEYTRVAVSSQDDVRPRQFRLVPSGVWGGTNYTTVEVQFGNSQDGGDGVRTPPPSPDDPKTYGAPGNWKPPGAGVAEDDDVDRFRILVQYQYRRNFDNASPDVNDYDTVEVSYSTGEVYNVALEVMPYRYLEEVSAGVWQPHGPATGVQMRGQVEVRNLSR